MRRAARAQTPPPFLRRARICVNMRARRFAWLAATPARGLVVCLFLKRGSVAQRVALREIARAPSGPRAPRRRYQPPSSFAEPALGSTKLAESQLVSSS